MPEIKKLDQLTAMQIAAGEVIDRPSAVIRELVENAIDAGATVIEVDVAKGGIESISVKDNGCGIAKDQLPLSIERHATSKISQIGDLDSLNSLGFRGEALASMASVARLAIITKPASQSEAWQLTTDGLNPLKIQPIAGVDGTTITVKDLFYLTPARRKFLKTERSEYIKIDDTIRKIALANPNCTIYLKHNGRKTREIPGSDNIANAKERISAILGNDFVEQLSFMDERCDLGQIKAWLAHPRYSRAQTDYQYVILNNRVIRDGGLSNAIKRAYQDIMMPGRHPAAVIYLEIDPKEVDFNVHPTKEQVKFRDIRQLSSFVVASMKRHLRDSLMPQSALVEVTTLASVAEWFYNNHPENPIVPITVVVLPITSIGLQKRSSKLKSINFAIPRHLLHIPVLSPHR